MTNTTDDIKRLLEMVNWADARATPGSGFDVPVFGDWELDNAGTIDHIVGIVFMNTGPITIEVNTEDEVAGYGEGRTVAAALADFVADLPRTLTVVEDTGETAFHWDGEQMHTYPQSPLERLAEDLAISMVGVAVVKQLRKALEES